MKELLCVNNYKSLLLAFSSLYFFPYVLLGLLINDLCTMLLWNHAAGSKPV